MPSGSARIHGVPSRLYSPGRSPPWPSRGRGRRRDRCHIAERAARGERGALPAPVSGTGVLGSFWSCAGRGSGSRGCCSSARVSVALVLAADGVGANAPARRPGLRRGSVGAALAQEWLVLFAWPLALAYWYPNGALPSRRWRPAGVARRRLVWRRDAPAARTEPARGSGRPGRQPARRESRRVRADARLLGPVVRRAALAARRRRSRCAPATGQAAPSSAGRSCGSRTARCCCRSGSAARRSSRASRQT